MLMDPCGNSDRGDRLVLLLLQKHRKSFLLAKDIWESTFSKICRDFRSWGGPFFPSKQNPGDRFHLEVSVSGPNSSQSSTGIETCRKSQPNQKKSTYKHPVLRQFSWETKLPLTEGIDTYGPHAP